MHGADIFVCTGLLQAGWVGREEGVTVPKLWVRCRMGWQQCAGGCLKAVSPAVSGMSKRITGRVLATHGVN